MPTADPAALSEQACKARCPSRVREGRIGDAALPLLGVMARVAGWRPEDFWTATPADVRAVLAGWAGDGADASIDGPALAAMMEAFPDG